jgi:ketosteroid isomerase-like protein
MQNILDQLNHLNELVLSGRVLEAFDQYYHDDVTMQENDQPPTVGKAGNREREIEFLSKVTDFRHASVSHVAVGDHVSYVTWQYDYTHADWGVRNYTQISVQHWKDGKIIREQFFYAN